MYCCKVVYAGDKEQQILNDMWQQRPWPSYLPSPNQKNSTSWELHTSEDNCFKKRNKRTHACQTGMTISDQREKSEMPSIKLLTMPLWHVYSGSHHLKLPVSDVMLVSWSYVWINRHKIQKKEVTFRKGPVYSTKLCCNTSRIPELIFYMWCSKWLLNSSMYLAWVQGKSQKCQK